MSFTHLHVHSQYSLLDGLPNIPDLVAKAKGLSMTALALTDHGAMYGIIEFYQACKKAGIKPIIGAEVYIAPRRYIDKQPRLDDRPNHLILLAETTEGYHHLIQLVTKSHLEGFYYKPRIDLDLLEQYHGGLIALSGCLNGPIARAITQRNEAAAQQLVERYQAIFGKNNFFLELQYHPNTPQQHIVNQALVRLSQTTGAPLVATTDSHYLDQTDADAQDILLCIQTKKQLADQDRLTMRAEDYSLASSEQMTAWFKDAPEALTNTQHIADRCTVDIPLGQITMPYYALPPDRTADEVLYELCKIGAQRRYEVDANNQRVTDRLRYELDIIRKTGFASYFLIVQDVVNWAKQHGIVVGPGRGSATGSMVAYVTGITNIDPLKYDLLFERFLNPERVSMPDIDLDITDTRRGEVIDYIELKYGKGHVAQIMTFGTMAARAAVRDVGRVLGISYSYCDRLAKLIPNFSTLDTALETVPELKQLYDSDLDASRLLDNARKLEGVVRHTSTHACGIVITKEPLENYTPVQYSAVGDNSIVTQYSLHSIESLGLLKMDLLGLKNLTIIENTIQLVQSDLHTTILLEKIPLDDKKTYRLLQRAQTTGIFQLESAGMKRYLHELKPNDFEDIIAMVALYRPGPMERIPEYIAGKHKKRTITYLHPILRPILEKTHGILVYQEQVMALARDLAGFSAGEGYLLIKAVAKKIQTLLLEQKQKFITGCIRNNITQTVADQIWEFIEPFARYGFNKSHSTGYALIAYHTAYLKANYPAHFMASLLTSDQSDSDRIAIEIAEARQLDIIVLPPDINESDATFAVVNDTIRFGLGAIKNVGQNLITAIISERTNHGVFQNVEDFFSRIHHKDLNRKSVESLIKSGAFTVLADAATLLSNIDTLLQYTKQHQLDKASGQTSLFQTTSVQAPRLRLHVAEPVALTQKLQWEKDLLGLYISSHPLTALTRFIVNDGFLTISTVLAQAHRSTIRVVGIISAVKRLVTKNNEGMYVLRLEDPHDSIEVMVFPSAVDKIKAVLDEGEVICVTGKVSKRNGQKQIIAEEITGYHTHVLTIVLQHQDKLLLDKIKAILDKHPGQIPVYLDIDHHLLKTKAMVSDIILVELHHLLGDSAVDLI